MHARHILCQLRYIPSKNKIFEQSIKNRSIKEAEDDFEEDEDELEDEDEDEEFKI